MECPRSQLRPQGYKLPNPQAFEADLVSVGCAVHEVDQSAVTPLQHAHVRLEVVAHANFDLGAGFVN